MVDQSLEAWLDEVLPLPPWLTADAAPALPRVVTRAAALGAGIGPAAISYRCRTGSWQRLAPAVYLTALPATPADRMRAGALHGGPTAAISGRAAARAWGLRSVPEASDVLVLVATSSTAKHWGDLRIRRSERVPHSVAHAGVPLAPIARAVADHVLGLRRLETIQAVLGEAVQRGLCTVDELGVELDRGPRRGSRLFREGLCDIGYGAHSAPEALAGRLLRAAGIGGFVQNAEVFAGGRRYVADFLWADLGAILEIDSVAHHLSPADHRATLARDQLLQAAGFAIVHVTPRQLRDGPSFIALVTEWLGAIRRRMLG